VEAARRLLAGSIRPDGLFCVTDLLALGFLDAARRDFALDVPRDLCVVGFDDIPEAGWLSYELTTFRQPISEMAEHIALALGDEAPAPASRQFPVRLVWRGTVRPRPLDPPDAARGES
jgi:DNA-binding LacI/PurR family transcriptional regulator